MRHERTPCIWTTVGYKSAVCHRRQSRKRLMQSGLTFGLLERGGGFENLRSCPFARTLIHAETLKSLVREADPSL
jgi:hypothetical protein